MSDSIIFWIFLGVSFFRYSFFFGDLLSLKFSESFWSRTGFWCFWLIEDFSSRFPLSWKLIYLVKLSFLIYKTAFVFWKVVCVSVYRTNFIQFFLLLHIFLNYFIVFIKAIEYFTIALFLVLINWPSVKLYTTHSSQDRQSTDHAQGVQKNRHSFEVSITMAYALRVLPIVNRTRYWKYVSYG